MFREKVHKVLNVQFSYLNLYCIIKLHFVNTWYSEVKFCSLNTRVIIISNKIEGYNGMRELL